ncbi:unnamed protein product [Lactuca saligna]|uniref:Uncharacterized protein n=1 Tax=Lactuca saligna TaxID=75948 RepID=A0AA35YYV1_LACSI|nr:unnamed protein product [Lactuca saligna]
MLGQCLNDSIPTYVLTSSFSIPTNWPLLAVHTSKQVLQMFKEMGYNPQISLAIKGALEKVFKRFVKDTPEIVLKKSEKLKLKSMSCGVVIMDVSNEKDQKYKKCKPIGLLKQFKKLRAQTIKEPFTTTKPTPNVFKVDQDSKEIDDKVIKPKNLTRNVSPREVANVKSNA